MRRIAARALSIQSSIAAMLRIANAFQMRCPTCEREFILEESTALPFCSERCRLIDLGRWLDEGFALPVVPDPDADETPEIPPADGHDD